MFFMHSFSFETKEPREMASKLTDSIMYMLSIVAAIALAYTEYNFEGEYTSLKQRRVYTIDNVSLS